MIPISDNIPSSSKPIGNYLLIGINIALFSTKTRDCRWTGNLVNSWCRSRSDYCSNGKRDHKWKPAAWIATDAIQFTATGNISPQQFSAWANLIFLWVFGALRTSWGMGGFWCSTCFGILRCGAIWLNRRWRCHWLEQMVRSQAS